MKPAKRRIDVNLDELDRVLDGARQAPLSEADYDKLKDALACHGGDAGAAAQYGEDQRRGGGAGDRKRQRDQPDTNAPPQPGTGGTAPRRSLARGRSRSRIRA